MIDHEELFERVATVVCGKPVGMPGEQCFGLRGRRNPLCQDHGRCRLLEKTGEQLAYVHRCPNTNSYLKACPGAGKTEVVGLKAALEMHRDEWRHCGIGVLTFTNSAADVIRERVNQFVHGVSYPHYIGTVDSWLHGYLLNPFAHLLTGYRPAHGDSTVRIVEDSSQAPFLNSFRTRYQYSSRGRVCANQYYTDLENDAITLVSRKGQPSDARNRPSLKDWQVHDFKETKRKFWAAGFATHQDVEVICCMLLDSYAGIRDRLAGRFPLVIVDECQDLSWIQMYILDALRNSGASVHLVGDLNQAIYAFKEVYPEKVRRFVKDAGLVELSLSQNFRSVQPIVDLCGKLVDQGEVTGRVHTGEAPACVYFVYDKGNIHSLLSCFEDYLHSRSISVANSAVVARGYATVNRLRPASARVPSRNNIALAMAIHLWKSGGVQGIDESLKCIGRFVSLKFFPQQSADSRHHYCPETERSWRRWRLFLARTLDECMCHKAIADLSQTWRKWAELVRTHLERIVADVYDGVLPQRNRAFVFRAPGGLADTAVVDSLQTVQTPATASVRITTIHQVKGEAFDAVLLVSAPTKRGDGGHWLHWLEDIGSQGEHARFAYVASSRPRKLLAWAIPNQDRNPLEKLEEIGFVPAVTENESTTTAS